MTCLKVNNKKLLMKQYLSWGIICVLEDSLFVKADNVSPDTRLNTYLRENLHLTATKKMCMEGGCGTCIVAVEEVDANGNKKVFAVNSCLVSIFSCHGWKILTNEGIGDPLKGYHQIQQILADNNGSQCGFCSSGMVMNMYALNASGAKTKAEIENSFGGNICRCTGYRSILTAFKKLAKDADDCKQIDDLEDFQPCNTTKCERKCPEPCKKSPMYYDLTDSKWVKVYNLEDLLELIRTSGSKTYMLVAGNTARGVYPNTGTPDIYVDITSVLELTTCTQTDSSVILGGNTALNDTMTFFRKVAKDNSKFAYLDKMADHIDLVAHVPVRNIGTIAGNLMIKHQHNEFQSDMFLILETVKATIIIVDVDGNETAVTPVEFLKVDMAKKVIKSIILNPYDETYHYTSYKIMKRAQNAHAMLNAGFLLKLNNDGAVQSARIVYGAINPTFAHASNTEQLLKGKQLFDNSVLQSAFASLDKELNPDWELPDPSPSFRKQLAINLFYKYVLSIAPDSKVSARNKSGGTLLTRPVSSGTQQIYSDKDLYPLTQPIVKLEALAQTSGQAKYVIDIPPLPEQLHGVFVKAQAIAGSVITSIDPAEALASPGVVAFYSAKDIPGINSIAVENLNQLVLEELFCTGTVQYYSQPVGVIIATSHEAARAAVSLVKISTTPPATKPILKVPEAVKKNISSRITHQTSVVPKKKGDDIKTTIKGTINIPSQYHYHMETHTCQVIPTEDGLNVYPGTQWMNHTQGVLSQVLKMPSKKISLFVRRLGGAFGAKATRSAFVSAAAGLAAVKLQKPVKMWMNIDDNMSIIGKRHSLYVEYEVGVNETGVIQYLEAGLYTDFGVGGNEPVDFNVVSEFENCYVSDTWTFDTYAVKTDNPGSSPARGPGSFEGLGSIETIMDHIAYTLNLDPLKVRMANMDKPNNPILVNFVEEVLKSDDIDKRKADVEAYNKANRWKKKGLSVIPMKWSLDVTSNLTTLVSIYHLDGGVVVTHGGIEMGQGINTKVAQVCAYKLGIPLEKVSVKPSYNVITPNAYASAGSMTSEGVVFALLKACDVLLERIKPIREKNPKASWEELIQLCYNAKVNLSSNGFYSVEDPDVKNYPIFGCCALEVEIDILTGRHEILRVDILEDVGQSMSPLIDIGQLEGGFIMGVGCHSTEELIYNSEGKLLTDRTWNYKPFGAKDIPQDFRVKFSNNTFNPVGVLKSKAIAEPPTCLSIALPLALRNALASARKDASSAADPWYTVDGPSTVEQTLLNTLNNYIQYTL